MLGLGLAVISIGGAVFASYLFSRLSYRSIGSAELGGAYEMQPSDQLVPERNDAGVTDPQQGASNIAESIDAQERSNEQLRPARRRDPNQDDPVWQGPGVDYVSANQINGVASFLAMATGAIEESNPEYQGPPIY